MKISEKIVLLISFFLLSHSAHSQREKLYDTDADGMQQFKNAVETAAKEKKNVMVQIGGNWCKWCYKFHDFYTNNSELDSIIKVNYVVIRINYDKSLKNKELLRQLSYPQRFGFPVAVICDAKGRCLHTQNTWYLEDGKGGYDKEKFKAFLRNWTPGAVTGEE